MKELFPSKVLRTFVPLVVSTQFLLYEPNSSQKTCQSNFALWFLDLFCSKGLISAIVVLVTTANSINAEIISIKADLAREKLITVNVERGQPSPIIFRNGEIIDAIKLGDMSKNVFSLNAPVESGKATTINITQSEGIDIPLATTAKLPIIDVETIDSNGVRQYYSFELHNNSADRSKFFIEPEAELKSEPELEAESVITTIATSYGLATPEDVKRGLELRIKERKIDPNNEIIMKIREYIALTQNGIAAIEAISSTRVQMSVIQKLAELGQEEKTRQRMMPLETDFDKFR